MTDLQTSDWSWDSPLTQTISSDRKQLENNAWSIETTAAKRYRKWRKSSSKYWSIFFFFRKICSFKSNPKACFFLQCFLVGILLAGVALAVVLSLWLTSPSTASRTGTTLFLSRRWPVLLFWFHRSVSKRSFRFSFDHRDDGYDVTSETSTTETTTTSVTTASTSTSTSSQLLEVRRRSSEQILRFILATTSVTTTSKSDLLHWYTAIQFFTAESFSSF